MKVPDVHQVVHGLDAVRQGRSAPAPATPSSSETRNADGDRLDVSLSSRIMGVSKDIAESAAALEPELSTERLEEIQQRIRTGFYDADDQLDDTGQRILDFYAN